MDLLDPRSRPTSVQPLPGQWSTSSAYNEQKERDLDGKQEPQIPSARSGRPAAAWSLGGAGNAQCQKKLPPNTDRRHPRLCLGLGAATGAGTHTSLLARRDFPGAIASYQDRHQIGTDDGDGERQGVEKLI